MMRMRFIAILLLLVGVWIGYADYTKVIANEDQAGSGRFKLGLDLSGGIYLEYLVDVSSLEPSEVPDAMDALRDLIERRVNVFGVSEPIVQTKKSGMFSDNVGERLIVQLPGVDDVKKAQDAIGAIPVLEFREHRTDEEVKAILAAKEKMQDAIDAGNEDFVPDPLALESIHKKGRLSGKNLSRASMQFDRSSKAPGGRPIIVLEFDKEGGELFAELTKENAGNTIPIYVDGELISEPTVGIEYAQTGITGGQAIISGQFSIDEAKDLAWRLNSGALPVDKMTLLESRTIGATLGADAFNAGVNAGIWGLILVAVFLILWYRLPGLVAVVALSAYVALMLGIFKTLPVIITAASIAGFILSIGMAVDANVLIFERMKEEMDGGRTIHDAIKEGFSRAWPSIRDGNLSSIITAVILFWFGTSLIEGFALTFLIGILLSMFSAITLTRTFLLSIAPSNSTGFVRKLFGNGFNSK